jgi:hypothetical protein
MAADVTEAALHPLNGDRRRIVMSTYWFRPQRNGSGGLAPITWQGWTITIGVPLALVAVCLLLSILVEAVWVAMAIYLPIAAVGVLGMILVAQRKTEGNMRWQLGRWARNRDSDRSL